MNFAVDISSLQLSLMIASAALVLIALIAVLLRTMPLRRYVKKSARKSFDDRSHLIRAAVIIFAHDDAESLAEMLPQVMTQNYAPGYEVIVVNDGDSTDVRDIVDQFMLRYPNLYFTSAPDGARNLSRKKLALTLGIKAAKAPVVVHTTSGARIHSSEWLSSIMRHFDPEGAVDVVIGFASAPPYEDRSFGARTRSFDSSIDALGWIGSAAAGNPWRGSEHNLAYRRDLFFRVKGFSKHLNLRDGDDDIFISEIARGFNTIVELSPESMVEVPGANMPRALADRLSRRRFTKRFIPRHPRIGGTVSTLAYFLAPLPLVTVPFIDTMPPVGWAYWAGILICWYAAGLLWAPSVRILRGRRLLFSTPLLAFSRPLRIISRTVRSAVIRNKRYTWE